MRDVEHIVSGYVCICFTNRGKSFSESTLFYCKYKDTENNFLETGPLQNKMPQIWGGIVSYEEEEMFGLEQLQGYHCLHQ